MRGPLLSLALPEGPSITLFFCCQGAACRRPPPRTRARPPACACCLRSSLVLAGKAKAKLGLLLGKMWRARHGAGRLGSSWPGASFVFHVLAAELALQGAAIRRAGPAAHLQTGLLFGSKNAIFSAKSFFSGRKVAFDLQEHIFLLHKSWSNFWLFGGV